MPLKILLADDHLVLLAGMRALLEREGYQVVADVSDGRQAVNLARRLQPQGGETLAYRLSPIRHSRPR